MKGTELFRLPVLAFFMALVLAAPGCRRARLSPEEQVRKAIDVVVKAVSERDIKPVAAAVSAEYADREGNDKKQIVSLVRVQFLLHPNLYLSRSHEHPAHRRVRTARHRRLGPEVFQLSGTHRLSELSDASGRWQRDLQQQPMHLEVRAKAHSL